MSAQNSARFCNSDQYGFPYAPGPAKKDSKYFRHVFKVIVTVLEISLLQNQQGYRDRSMCLWSEDREETRRSVEK